MFTTKITIYIINKLQIIIWYLINLFTYLHHPNTLLFPYFYLNMFLVWERESGVANKKKKKTVSVGGWNFVWQMEPHQGF